MATSEKTNAAASGALTLADEVATAAFGAALATRLRVGDVVLLGGDLGAGKTALARAAVQSLMEMEEDVPSPTFTLVQTYETKPPVWHADLYRLSDPDEVVELGLLDAFDEAIVFIEWPDRLGPFEPERRLFLSMRPDATGGRRIEWAMVGDDWDHVWPILRGMP